MVCDPRRKSPLFHLAAGIALLLTGACAPSTSDLGLPRASGFALSAPRMLAAPAVPLGPAQGEVIGTGPVRVALILPLSGTGSAVTVGRAMANGARLAIEHAARSGPSAIHLVLKDTGGDEARARAAALEAVGEGASLILGPLRASAVAAAGAVARDADIPLIGFSNTGAVARPGVYLMAVLPEAETMRVLAHARAQGARAATAIVPATAYGEAMGEAFQRAASEMGLPVRGVHVFADETQARQAVERLAPHMLAGEIDTLFLPDRATAPSFAILLAAAGVPRERLVIMGSGEWAGDAAILAQPYLADAVYPAVDPAGLAALGPQYSARFGSAPHPFASLAYSAVLLAGNPVLAGSAPRYGPQSLLSPAGFSGRDGPFRFHHDGRGEYGLAVYRVAAEGAVIADPARLGGITREMQGVSAGGSAIPAVGASLLR